MEVLLGEPTVGRDIEVRHHQLTVEEAWQRQLSGDRAVGRLLDYEAAWGLFESQTMRKEWREQAARDCDMRDRPAVADVMDELAQLSAPQKSGGGPN